MTQGLPLTYAEARWGDDLDPNGAETASDLESLEQDVLHLLEETLGSNLADPDSGLGLEEVLGGDASVLTSLPALVDAQLAEDSRIDGSSTTLTQQPDGTYLLQSAVEVGGAVVPLEFAVGPGGVSLVS